MGCWEFCDPSSILFLLPTDLEVSIHGMYVPNNLVYLCMNVLEKCQVGRCAIRRGKIKKKRQNTLEAINDRVGIYNVSLLSLSLSLSPSFSPSFSKKDKNQMLLPQPAAAAAS